MFPEKVKTGFCRWEAKQESLLVGVVHLQLSGRKKSILALALAVLLLFGGAGGAALAAAITIQLDGQNLSLPVPPIVDSGYTLVPLRVIAENMGATVDYNGATKGIAIQKEQNIIKLQVGSKNATINGVSTTLQMPARVVNGNTLVPLRFVSESLGAQVDWIESRQLVVITSATVTDIPVYSPAAKAVEQAIMTYINKQRTAIGLNELIEIAPLTQFARAHSQDMAENNYFDHTSPAKGTVTRRAQSAGIPAPAENIAMGYTDAQSVFEGWLSSTGHRQNMLDAQLNFIGVGIYYNPDGTMYVTANFLSTSGFFVGPHTVTAGSDKVQVKGYAKNSGQPITIYQVNTPADTVYVSKKTVDITVDANHAFTATLPLWEKGYFFVILGSDQITAQNP